MGPLDIWRSAKRIVDRHGGDAPAECERRAATFKAGGDQDGETVWRATSRAARSLINGGPPEDV